MTEAVSEYITVFATLAGSTWDMAEPPEFFEILRLQCGVEACREVLHRLRSSWVNVDAIFSENASEAADIVLMLFATMVYC